MTSRLWGALAAYVVLAALAASLLHGTVLYTVLALFGGLALKTLIAEKAGWNKHSAHAESEPVSSVNSQPDSKPEHEG